MREEGEGKKWEEGGRLENDVGRRMWEDEEERRNGEEEEGRRKEGGARGKKEVSGPKSGETEGGKRNREDEGKGEKGKGRKEEGGEGLERCVQCLCVVLSSTAGAGVGCRPDHSNHKFWKKKHGTHQRNQGNLRMQLAGNSTEIFIEEWSGKPKISLITNRKLA